jgi:hypothetical protein
MDLFIIARLVFSQGFVHQLPYFFSHDSIFAVNPATGTSSKIARDIPPDGKNAAMMHQVQRVGKDYRRSAFAFQRNAKGAVVKFFQG